MLLLKRRDGVYFETEGAFPQAGSAKHLYKQQSGIFQEERNVLEFEMVILKLLLSVRIFMFARQCLGFETTLRATKVEETFVYNTRGLKRKDRDFSIARSPVNPI